MYLTQIQKQTLLDIKAGRVSCIKASGRWTILDNTDYEGEGDEAVHIATTRSLIYHGLVQLVPHQSSPHVEWVQLTDAGQVKVDRIIAQRDGSK